MICSEVLLVDRKYSTSTGYRYSRRQNTPYHSNWDEVPAPGFLRRNCGKMRAWKMRRMSAFLSFLYRHPTDITEQTLPDILVVTVVVKCRTIKIVEKL